MNGENVKRNLDFCLELGYHGVWIAPTPSGQLSAFYSTLETHLAWVKEAGLATAVVADSTLLPAQRYEHHVRYLLTDIPADYVVIDASPAANPFRLRRLLQTLSEPPKGVALGILPMVAKWMEWTDGVDTVALHSLPSESIPEGKTTLLLEKDGKG
jgi:hypothetical protein